MMLKGFMNNEESRRLYHLKRNTQKEAFPIRLQAYERFVLFLERISLPQLLVRVKGSGLSASNYKSILIQTVRTEFEHNLAQQIYVSPESWRLIKAAKDATLNIISVTAANLEEGADGLALSEAILKKHLENEMGPSERAIHFITTELREEF